MCTSGASWELVWLGSQEKEEAGPPIILGDGVSQPPTLPPTPPLSHPHLTSALEMRADVMSERPRGRIKGSEEKADYGLHLKRLNQGWGDKEGSGRELGVPDTGEKPPVSIDLIPCCRGSS